MRGSVFIEAAPISTSAASSIFLSFAQLVNLLFRYQKKWWHLNPDFQHPFRLVVSDYH